tara:strand:- start:1087 stop:1458 length:372 start_codon:yes stop_codon:yes gene_type:complete
MNIFIILASLLVLVIAYFLNRPGGIRGTIMAYRVGSFLAKRLYTEIESCGGEVASMDINIGVGNAWFSIDPGDEEHRVILELIAKNVCREFRQDRLEGSAILGHTKTEFRFRSRGSACFGGGV